MLLSRLIGPPPIDFALRLELSLRKRPRMLSICSGEAGVEAGLINAANTHLDLVLLDINPRLLARAAAKMPTSAKVTLWEGAAEELRSPDELFDIVCFVSGLHHVIGLEEVLGRAANCLDPGGEFWLIGEQVGRDGGRLQADAFAMADGLFRNLPSHLRHNANSGVVDVSLPNPNLASSCFEGIRSADIPQAIRRHFVPIVEDLRNGFLWRFVDLAYASNFDMANPDDLKTIKEIVACEAIFWRNGELGSELNGVYRPKKLLHENI